MSEFSLYISIKVGTTNPVNNIMSLPHKFKCLAPLLQMAWIGVVLITIPWCSRSLATAQVIQPNCSATCGNVSIPYPFGTSADCHLNGDTKFYIGCYESSGSPTAYLGEHGNLRVTNISLDGQLELSTPISRDCYDSQGNKSNDGTRLNVSFPISYSHNKFILVGCDTYGRITSGDTSTGCIFQCSRDSIANINGSCSGVGCCESPIPKDLKSFAFTAYSFNKHADVIDINPCSYGFVAKDLFFHFTEGDLNNNLRNLTEVSTILDWAIGNQTCEEAFKNTTSYACRANSICVKSANGPGYYCSCSSGYQGNPYMPNGCTDINECGEIPKKCGDNDCKNRNGSYECSCKSGYIGSPSTGCIATQLVIEITVGIAMGLSAFLVVGSRLYWGYKKRKQLLLKQKFFEQNGGLLLRLELSEREGYSKTAKIFTANELKEATNNFDEARIIGEGGFGTVYKGILDDGSVIAIKKPKVMNQNQIEQFINEVIVLSQINHRNVVRLLGCCLETEVPLLVYKFISNGTLFDHLHDSTNTSAILSWEIRLRISVEIAGVLAYLHSDAVMSIIHGDIKSTNILLDENHTAKVSDFGASRLVPMNQDQVCTMVQGTIGYLDPEYLHTSQLTEKSDVYSFGVVLVELMTGKKALAFDRPEEERCLAMFFILSTKKKQLFEVVEDGLANDGNRKQIEEAASLALACLRINGDERPTMREVASELQGQLSIGKHPWIMDANVTSEESEQLLSSQLLDGFDISDSTGCDTTVGYDSIIDHVALSVGMDDDSLVYDIGT